MREVHGSIVYDRSAGQRLPRLPDGGLQCRCREKMLRVRKRFKERTGMLLPHVGEDVDIVAITLPAEYSCTIGA